MGIKSWLGFEGGGSGGSDVVDLNDYLENLGLHNGELLDEDKYTYVKAMTCDSTQVIPDVERELGKGNIVLLNVSSLMHSNRVLLKKIVDELRKIETRTYGDMARISEDKILVVPKNFRILKRSFKK